MKRHFSPSSCCVTQGAAAYVKAPALVFNTHMAAMVIVESENRIFGGGTTGSEFPFFVQGPAPGFCPTTGIIMGADLWCLSWLSFKLGHTLICQKPLSGIQLFGKSFNRFHEGAFRVYVHKGSPFGNAEGQFFILR